jgi:TctA family transporter
MSWQHLCSPGAFGNFWELLHALWSPGTLKNVNSSLLSALLAATIGYCRCAIPAILSGLSGREQMAALLPLTFSFTPIGQLLTLKL